MPAKISVDVLPLNRFFVSFIKIAWQRVHRREKHFCKNAVLKVLFALRVIFFRAFKRRLSVFGNFMIVFGRGVYFSDSAVYNRNQLRFMITRCWWQQRGFLRGRNLINQKVQCTSIWLRIYLNVTKCLRILLTNY